MRRRRTAEIERVLSAELVESAREAARTTISNRERSEAVSARYRRAPRLDELDEIPLKFAAPSRRR